MKQPVDREALILKYRPLAIGMARKRFPGCEEAESQAVLGLTVAVERLATKGIPHDNVGGYIVKYIKQFMFKTDIPTSPEAAERVVLDQDGIVARDLIEHIAKDALDHIIISQRLAGYSDEEIGTGLGYSKAYIHTRRQVLQERLTRLR